MAGYQSGSEATRGKVARLSLKFLGPLQVTFEAHEDDDVWIPLFEPAAEA